MFKPIGVQARVRRTHEERVLAALRAHGAQSRLELSGRAGISRTTLSEIVAELLGRGAIRVVDTDAHDRTGSGRPAARLALDPSSGQYLGIDFGHRRTSMVVVDASHEVIASGVVRLDEAADWSRRLESALGLADDLAASTGVHYGALQAIAIGVPGWGGAGQADAAAAALAEHFAAPVTVDNNVRFAALAEAAKSGPGGVPDLIYVRLSDGVGGGLVVDGRLVQGWARFAGELGHVTVDPAGVACRCGKHGCLETVASVPAVLTRCCGMGLAVNSLVELEKAIRASHPVATEVLRDAGASVGRVMGAAAMTLNPRELVIGGELAQMAPVLIDEVRATVQHELSWQLDAAPTVRAARLGGEAGALGAVIALLRESPLLANYPDAAAAPQVEQQRQRA